MFSPSLKLSGTILALGGQTTKIIDKGSIELIGPFGLEKGLLNLSKNIAKLDTGIITSPYTFDPSFLGCSYWQKLLY